MLGAVNHVFLHVNVTDFFNLEASQWDKLGAEEWRNPESRVVGGL